MRVSGMTSPLTLANNALLTLMRWRRMWPAAVLLGILAIIPIAASALARPPVPPSFEVTGFSGHLGEWEMTATLARNGTSREFTGPLKMTHVGWCSQDGPEVKTGELSLKLARLVVEHRHDRSRRRQ